MKSIFAALLVFCCVCGGTCDAQDAFPLQAKRILFLGDSITNSGYYISDIETQLRIQGAAKVPELINLGLSSETCSGLSEPDHPFPRPDVHERLDRALAKVKPDVVVACYGMNDGIYHPFDNDRFSQYQAGVNKLIAKVHAANAKLVLVTPPPFDPLPLRSKPGKLLPAGQEKYAWFSVFEGYDSVIDRYAKWIMLQKDQVDVVIDVHTPLKEFLVEQRKSDSDFFVAPDGVHMDEVGHQVMATAILKAWGVESWEDPSNELRSAVKKKMQVLHNAWLSEVGHKRPGVKAGLPLKEAQEKAAELQQKIQDLAKQAQAPVSRVRKSTGGSVSRIHYPASLKSGELKLYADYYLWIPDGVSQLKGIILHQHGCGPGASIGGQTVTDDLHWQELARRQSCALMGSSYEPRKGVNCRLWCDARNGSADRFLQAIDDFAELTGHSELMSAPWCLWGHSGGGFWASLMQTMYPKRIVAIWLQSGTAFGYWQKGDIETPKFSPDVFGVPVMACPGLQEKQHERFHVAYSGSAAMQKEYLAKGAPFFEFAADPLTSHECGDSRYLSIPFFDFWLSHRVGRSTEGLKTVDKTMLSDWDLTLKAKQAEFMATGSVSDHTPPASPTNVTIQMRDGVAVLQWDAVVDFESGLQGFVVSRDGNPVATIPSKATGRFGRPLFQKMSYHDTPELPLPKMELVLPGPQPESVVYSVVAVNSVGLKSAESRVPQK